MLTGRYKVAAVTVKVGYEYLKILPPSNPNLTNIQHYFGIFVPKPAVNATGEQRYGVLWVGGDYTVTPKFDMGVGFYNINTYNNPEIARNYLANAYSLLADYTFTRKFDAYIGVMVMQYSGVGLIKQAPMVAYSSNSLYGVGLRFRF
jgi:predicted porin